MSDLKVKFNQLNLKRIDYLCHEDPVLNCLWFFYIEKIEFPRILFSKKEAHNLSFEVLYNKDPVSPTVYASVMGFSNIIARFNDFLSLLNVLKESLSVASPIPHVIHILQDYLINDNLSEQKY